MLELESNFFSMFFTFLSTGFSKILIEKGALW